MLSKYTQKNNYGGYTWQIKLDSLFHVFINSTNNESYVVDFKEWKWVSYKTRFSFVSNSNLEDTITEALEKVFDYFKSHKDYEWTEKQMNNKLQEVLAML